ncbi:type II toxin-antitoxin system VapC family toxin [Candidatus Sumerlaeota bacterium]|nr:type II toxin-antitoxin system VapC family toxin [Candidatus Sumerlaeota bacterium]
MAKQRPTLYIETSVISYLTARPSKDVLHLARQQSTREWWLSDIGKFDSFISEVVYREASLGDAQARKARLEVLARLKVLKLTPKITDLAAFLLRAKIMPENAADDALHLAVASVNKLDFLASWNFRHLANAAIRHNLESVAQHYDLFLPTICTPEELKGE